MSSHDLEYLFNLPQINDKPNSSRSSDNSRTSIFFTNSSTQVLIPKDVKQEIAEDFGDVLDISRPLEINSHEIQKQQTPTKNKNREKTTDGIYVLKVSQDNNDTIHIEYLTDKSNESFNVLEDEGTTIDIKEEDFDFNEVQEVDLQSFETSIDNQELEETENVNESPEPVKKRRTSSRQPLTDFSIVEKVQTRQRARDAKQLQSQILEKSQSKDEKVSICPFKGCNKELTSKYLNQHIKVVHNKLRKKCLRCGNEIVPSHVSRHREKCGMDLKKEVKCKFENCSAVFRTSKEIYQHEWNVHRERIPCPYKGCDAVIKPAGVRKHVRSMHEALKEKCKNCGNSFKKKYITQHLKICVIDKTFERKYKCSMENCNSRFRLASDVKSHIWRVHRNPIPCPYDGCDSMVNPIRMEQHIKYVHDKRQIQCQQCNKVIMESSLHCHLKTCNGEARFPCHVKGCTSKFKNSTERNQHLDEVHKSAFSCTYPDCEKIFMRQSVYRRHVRMIHTDPVKTCLNCNKEFRSSYMYKHNKVCKPNTEEE